MYVTGLKMSGYNESEKHGNGLQLKI